MSTQAPSSGIFHIVSSEKNKFLPCGMELIIRAWIGKFNVSFAGRWGPRLSNFRQRAGQDEGKDDGQRKKEPGKITPTLQFLLGGFTDETLLAYAFCHSGFDYAGSVLDPGESGAFPDSRWSLPRTPIRGRNGAVCFRERRCGKRIFAFYCRP